MNIELQKVIMDGNKASGLTVSSYWKGKVYIKQSSFSKNGEDGICLSNPPPASKRTEQTMEKNDDFRPDSAAYSLQTSAMIKSK
mmetsp:Transcript_23117/g.26505  ORF Transcript_23117/g.26505 Transcript_23117/m.26505 type:complete len:84 (-) Transcript_23117:338-589(-)